MTNPFATGACSSGPGAFKHGLVGPQLLEVRTPGPELVACASAQQGEESTRCAASTVQAGERLRLTSSAHDDAVLDVGAWREAGLGD